MQRTIGESLPTPSTMFNRSAEVECEDLVLHYRQRHYRQRRDGRFITVPVQVSARCVCTKDLPIWVHEDLDRSGVTRPR